MATDGGDQGRSELRDFRVELRRCLTRWGDALFELGDAVLCAPHAVGSVPALSLEPVFRRSHGSLYKALEQGRIDEDGLRRLLVASRPPSWPNVFAVDASTWARCDAECSPERGFCYSPSRHSAGQPIVAGWAYQWISQLSWASDSWTAPLDAMRIAPTANATDATIAQVRRMVDLLDATGDVPLFVFDAGYDPIALSAGLADDRAQVLCRVRSDRVFYTDPAPRRRGARGRPALHGRRIKLCEPKSLPPPDAALDSDDPRYGAVRVRAWRNLHPRLSRSRRWRGCAVLPIVRGWVIRVEVEHLPKHDAGEKKTLWLWWSGPGEPDLALCMPRLLATLRHRAHLPVREEHARLDLPGATRTRASRPLDVARRHAALMPPRGLYRLAAQLGRELPQINRVPIALVRSTGSSVFRTRRNIRELHSHRRCDRLAESDRLPVGDRGQEGDRAAG